MNTLKVLLGNDSSTHTDIFFDFAKHEQLLLCGRNVPNPGLINSLHSILSQLQQNTTPQKLQFIIADLHHDLLDFPSDNPYLATPIITDYNTLIAKLCWFSNDEHQRRCDLFHSQKCQTLTEYSSRSSTQEPLERLIFVINGFDDIMLDEQYRETIEALIAHNGMRHLAPRGLNTLLVNHSVNDIVIPNSLKTYLPQRLIFQVQDQATSDYILDRHHASSKCNIFKLKFKSKKVQTSPSNLDFDASHLNLKGDALYFNCGQITHLQCPLAK